MITITTEAAEKVLEARTNQGWDETYFLRVGIAGGGCSGLKYELAFDKDFAPEIDVKFTSDKLSIVTRKKYAEFLDGTEIDFKVSPMGIGFALENPNFPSGLGCAGCQG